MADARVEASLMDGAKAMADNAEIGGGRRRPRWIMAAWAGAAALVLLPFFALFVLVATDDGENVKLTRNDIIREASGDRTWRGAFTNRTGRPYEDVAVVMLFLDADGEPVAQARGSDMRLEPGDVLNVQARLPSRARSAQVYLLRWRTGDDRRVLGPHRPWPFGSVPG
jgi:hypothetical protein